MDPSVFILFVGVAIFVLGVLMQLQSRLQFGWLPVAGTIVESTTGFSSSYHPQIQYEYVHDGRRLRGLEVRTHKFMGTWPGAANKVLARYPVGASVTVYVDPEDPEDAVLEPGGDPHFFWFVYCFSAFWLFLGFKQLLT